MTEPTTVTAAILVIGDEILSGRTKDKNIGYIAEYCTAIGIDVKEVRVVPDEEDEIIPALNTLRAKYGYVFTTGGIGPTHDDITTAAIARAFGVEQYRDQKTVDLFLQHYKPEDLNEQRLKMCDFPVGATLIENSISRAPGYQVENVFVLAGVPVIMQAMFQALKDRVSGGEPVKSRTIVAHMGEGDLAKGLGDVQDAHSDVEIGSYPFFRKGVMGSALVLRSADEEALTAAAQAVWELVEGLGVEPFEE